MVNYRDEDEITYYEVVHPLDDEPEQKLCYKSVGLIRMTPTVRISLMALRVYLLLMIGLVFYRVLQEAGLFGGK
jgi:hypothetical protein